MEVWNRIGGRVQKREIVRHTTGIFEVFGKKKINERSS